MRFWRSVKTKARSESSWSARGALVTTFSIVLAACGRTELDPGNVPGGGFGGVGLPLSGAAGIGFGGSAFAGRSSFGGSGFSGSSFGGTFGQAGAFAVGGGGSSGSAGGGSAGQSQAGEASGGAPACPAVGEPGCAPEPKVIQLAAGDDHTCALFSDGRVKCWGKNNHGQLGYGNTENIGDDELPSSVGFVSVSAKPGVTVSRLAASVEHTCALLSDSTVVCWGSNTTGQLGYGNVADVGDDELPSSVGAVSVAPSSGITATAIGTGSAHTCALLSNATVRCWGADGHGALGYGNMDIIGDDELPSSVGPVSLSTIAGVVPVALMVGRSLSCVLLSDDTAKCWGFNDFGQLGYGNTQTIGDDELPSSVGSISLSTTPGVVPVKLVGGDFHTCALLSDNNVRCWGSSIDGELGYGNRTRIGDDELPSSVEPISLGSPATGLTGGFNQNCAFLSDQSVRCWGSNYAGQLGNGNVENVGDDELPSSVDALTVTAGLTVKVITAGDTHTCALLSDGTVKCWGRSNFGQLGYGNTTAIGDDELPTSVGPIELL